MKERIGKAAALLVQEQHGLGTAASIEVGTMLVPDGRYRGNGGYRESYEVLALEVRPPLNGLMENQVFWLHRNRPISWNQK